MGGTLASAHSIDHLLESSHVHLEITKSGLDRLIHSEEEDELECELLSLLVPAQQLFAHVLDFPLLSKTCGTDVAKNTFFPSSPSALLPPSRAPPTFS